MESGGHKRKKKTSRCGPQKPKERDDVSFGTYFRILEYNEDWVISDFLEPVWAD